MVKARKDQSILKPVYKIVIGESISPAAVGMTAAVDMMVQILNINRDETRQQARSDVAKKGGDVSNEPHRKLHASIRDVWAKGSYSSRDICSQEEWQAVGFNSQKAARNALLNTPNPNPWTAQKQPKKRSLK